MNIEEEYTKNQTSWIMAHKLEVGDIVTITRKAESYEDGWGCWWADQMDDLVGNSYKVLGAHDRRGIRIDYDTDIHVEDWVPYFILEPRPVKDHIQVSKQLYPHVCPSCGAPAYIGLNNIDCSSCKK